MFSLFVAALFGIAAVQASPAQFSRRDSTVVTPLSADQVKGYDYYTWLSKLPYCGSTIDTSMHCGAACSNLPDFTLVGHGGDGDDVQYWIVGYSKSLNSVTVAHQGTNKSQTGAILTDLDLTKGPVDPSLFPKLPLGVEVHNGFQKEYGKTALEILNLVQSTMSKYNTQSVTLSGHSLGAALAVLETVFLKGRLAPTTTFKTVVYGLPRVGNKVFADYIDANVPITHITNMKDPVPIIPGRTLLYEHPSGEIHITESGTWGNCGRENPSPQCSDGDVPDIHKSVEADHDGPYNGIMLGRCE